MASPGKLIPLILAGGEGKRLWPLSTVEKPKQFLPLVDGMTLLETTLKRCESKVFDPTPIIVAAAADSGQFPPAIDLILEPHRRSSCAAIIAGTLHALSRDPNAHVLVMPCDHIISNDAVFERALLAAQHHIELGAIVTFGVEPTHPAEAYGYILPAVTDRDAAGQQIAQFIEKPNAARAAEMIAKGALWNSGMFAFKASALLHEAQVLAPDILHHTSVAYEAATHDGAHIRLEAMSYAACPAAAFDRAIMEKTNKGCVLPMQFGWTDVGSWDAVDALLLKDNNQNHASQNAHIHNSANVTVHASGKPTLVVGCEDIIVVTTDEGILVMKKGAGEDLKEALEKSSLLTSHRS
jgi:mannose-1-phosphate guanylyltransferase / mannose-6-phosphate isomerase